MKAFDEKSVICERLVAGVFGKKGLPLHRRK